MVKLKVEGQNDKCCGQIDQRLNDSTNLTTEKLTCVTNNISNAETCPIDKIVQNLYFDFDQTFSPNSFINPSDTKVGGGGGGASRSSKGFS